MPLSPRRFPSVIWLSLVWACGDSRAPEPGRPPHETGRYEPTRIPGYANVGERCSIDYRYTREAAFDQESPLGFSAKDAVKSFNAAARGMLRWEDGSSEKIRFHLDTELETIEYDDFPRDQGYCVPSVMISRFTLTIESSDAGIGARVEAVRDREKVFGAVSDGRGGISLLLFTSLGRLPVDSVDSPLVEQAAAAHPEHDERYITLTTLSVGFGGHKATCLPGEEISDDPLEHCNRFDGVLLYVSHPSDVFENVHHIDASKIYEQPLATWMWDR